MRLFAQICRFILAFSAITVAATASESQPLPQYFRSDGGIADSHAGPLPERLDAPGAMVWRTPLDPGQSTPILCGGKIFLTAFNQAAREIATVALDSTTGGILWRRVAPTPRLEEYHPQTGGPAAPTPACDGERLYVFFGSYGLICYNLDGQQLWERRMGPFQDEYGAGSSPILMDDKVILSQDHDIDSFVMAFDRSTGQTLWKTTRPAAVRSYSTPVVWEHGGQKELLVAGALELASYNPANGEKLWSVDGLARIVIPLPVVSSNMIYMASWAPGGDSGSRLALQPWDRAVAQWDANKDGKLAKSEITDPEVRSRFFRIDLNQDGQLDHAEWDRHAEVFRLAQNAMLAFKPEGKGNLTDKALVWKHPRGAPYVTTPLLDKSVLWMVKDGGIVTRLDAATGASIGEERLPGPGSYYASPVAGDGKVYFASESGVVSVIADQPEWKVISTRDFGEKIYATPAIARERLYLRTYKALYCFKAVQ